MLIIQPIGGLCNRMRAINSALVLAEMRGDHLHVLWNVNHELGCPFEHLFSQTNRFTLNNIYSKYDLGKLYYQLTCRRIGNEQIRSNRDSSGLVPEFTSTLPRRLYIATEEHFFPSHDYTAFAANYDIRKKVNDLKAGFGSRCVGVHIRRTDNKPSIDGSSTDAFVDQIRKELAQDPETVFYLATDDLGEEENLRKLFPGKIISNENRDLSRETVTGIQDALVDLLALSETSKIIGSYYSSFTDIAADMHSIPKVIAGKD
ncbi:MAG: hypothetical protein K5739_10610 [Lachnospiraceae bacterium]|nr:hypothetical protein [Lachnospiraceae bacterium]